MIEIISDRTPVARKDYPCSACEWVNSNCHWTEIELTFSEYRSVVKAKENNFEIKKGEKYVYQFNKHDGRAYVYRAIPEIHAICIIYDLYGE